MSNFLTALFAFLDCILLGTKKVQVCHHDQLALKRQDSRLSFPESEVAFKFVGFQRLTMLFNVIDSHVTPLLALPSLGRIMLTLRKDS